MNIEVVSISGKSTGRSIELSNDVFGIEPNNHAIYLDVKQYLAHQRQGTHQTKERSQVSGSTKKLGRQKGGGGARRGSIKSHILKGGARAFGPKSHDYGFKLNKKIKQLARKSALTHKAVSNNLIVIEDFNLETPKTSEFVKILKNLQADTVRSLVVIDGNNKNIILSGRNVPKTAVMNCGDLNTYSIMKAGKVVISESAAKSLVSQLSQN